MWDESHRRPWSGSGFRRGLVLPPLLLLLLLLHCTSAIYIPEEDGPTDPTPPTTTSWTSPTRPMSAVRSPGGYDGYEDGDDLITVHAGKPKPQGPWRAAPPAAAPLVLVDRDACPDADPRGARRVKRLVRSRREKPEPVRIVEPEPQDQPKSTFVCPESWQDIDFSEVRELECPENATGWFPFPPDCRKYLNCWKGRGFLQACAPATFFSPTRRECDYPEKVQCLPDCHAVTDDYSSEEDERDPTLFVDPDDPDAISPLLDARSAPEKPVRRVPPPAAATSAGAGAGARRRRAAAVSCDMEGGTGLAAHPTDCTKFLNCWQGRPHIQSCGPGTVFNPAFSVCDHPYNVPGCGKDRDQGQGQSQGQSQGYQRPSAGNGAGGYNQFGNQGYQPPPKRPKPTASYFDQTPAASGYQGYRPNQVQPPPSQEFNHKQRELGYGSADQYLPDGQGPTAQAAPTGQYRDPNGDVEQIGSGGVIGPLPPGHTQQWHRDHSQYPMPGSSSGSGVPAGHHHHHHNGHGGQGGSQYSPQPGYSSYPGGSPPHHHHHHQQQGGYTPHQQGGYTPQYQKEGYSPGSDSATPGHHHHQHSRPGYHDPQWHRDHNVPMPGQSGQPGGQNRGNPYGYTAPTQPQPQQPWQSPPQTTPMPATTTPCPPFLTGEGDDDQDNQDPDQDLNYDLDPRTSASGWKSILDRTKNDSMPQSGQMVRLRGGPSPLEGYVEVVGPGSTWGAVCDQPGNWTVAEASIVCKMLGYERGAELAWQGRPRDVPGQPRVHVEGVTCSGSERHLMECSMSPGDAGDGCDLETQAAGLRCYPNWAARCRPGETPFKGSCYSVVVPRQDRKVDAIAFSQDEAIKHCKSQGGHLLDINSQAESDFVSEWLSTSFPALGSVLTAGVGVSVPGRDVWVWEDTGAPFKYNLWWPGPPTKEFDAVRAPRVGERSLCVLLKKDFPCNSWPGRSSATSGSGSGYGNWQGARSCPAEYFFWHAEDCAVRQKAYPYVCERKADDVGCLGPSSAEYEGAANVSWTGAPCLPWDSPAAVSTLRYRVSDAVRRKTLSGHNYCRRVSNNHDPWCFVDAGQAGLKVERCDIPPCSSKVMSRAALHCGPQQFECGPNECIPNVWQCDGEQDCSNGLDEHTCANYLLQFRAVHDAKLEKHDRERWLHLDANTCARRCLDSTDFVCKSFSYRSSTKVCHLSGTNVGETGDLVRTNRTGWAYYEVEALADSCNSPAKFLCKSGKCINATDVCNGRNDCGDPERSDEASASCTAASIGYDLRLSGGKAKNEGRIEVKVNGIWGGVCDDGFGLPEADVVCREAGYRDGAVEVMGSSMLPPPPKPIPILVDELLCSGNETSLRLCDHAGWGVHDCAPEEMVGVRCAVAAGLECTTADQPTMDQHGGFAWGSLLQLVTKQCRRSSRACPENQWQCESGECVPSKFLCDSVEDCKDGSDEHAKRCSLPMELRLAGGRNRTEGRLEVKVYGEWGSVCDDDFNEAAAVAVCRSLGVPGKAQVFKEAHFGQGQGIIWMDSVRCAGNESSLEQCRHDDFGVTNCKHDEDVGVACLGGGPEAESTSLAAVGARKEVDVAKYLPAKCGTRSAVEGFTPTVQLAKVVSGRGTPRGAYPWQASIRVRSGLKSVHWCGAVVVGPLHVLTAAHCLQDYTKGAYFIRVGDYDSEEDDGTEQEANIDSIHVHEEFNKNVYLESDIALVKVTGAGFRMTDSVQPACLPSLEERYDPGINCSISGWGSIGTSGAGHSRLLRSAWLPILPTETCSASDVYGTKAIVPGMFCAGHLDGGADSCQGDSGGPMVCVANDRFTLYGITSWGLGCGMAKKPGVYSNVAHYLPWVHDKVRKSVAES